MEILTSDHTPLKCGLFGFFPFYFSDLTFIVFLLHFSMQWLFIRESTVPFNFLRANHKSVSTCLWSHMGFHMAFLLMTVPYSISYSCECLWNQVLYLYLYYFLHWWVDDNSGCISKFLLYLSIIRLEDGPFTHF